VLIVEDFQARYETKGLISISKASDPSGVLECGSYPSTVYTLVRNIVQAAAGASFVTMPDGLVCSTTIVRFCFDLGSCEPNCIGS